MRVKWWLASVLVASDRVKLALGGTILADKLALLAGDGDEVALLPPVSGG